MSDSLQPHESQHARPPCPSPTPGAYSNPCPSSRWCHPAISSSVVPFPSCPQSLPASGSFPMSQLPFLIILVISTGYLWKSLSLWPRPLSWGSNSYSPSPIKDFTSLFLRHLWVNITQIKLPILSNNSVSCTSHFISQSKCETWEWSLLSSLSLSCLSSLSTGPFISTFYMPQEFVLFSVSSCHCQSSYRCSTWAASFHCTHIHPWISFRVIIPKFIHSYSEWFKSCCSPYLK